MVRLLHVTVFEGVGVASHKEPYACAELLDITGRPIKKERVKTSVRENLRLSRSEVFTILRIVVTERTNVPLL